MPNWTVDVRGAGISAGVQLDFCADGFADHEPVPLLAVGDSQTFIFPSNDRRSGTVFSADPDKGIIEVDGVRLSVRRAIASDSLIPSAAGTRSASWIIGARIP